MVGVPSLVVNVTLVSPALMVLSVATSTPLTLSTALPPVATPATIVAWPVRAVLLALSALAITVPPTAVKLTALTSRVSKLMAGVLPADPSLSAASVYAPAATVMLAVPLLESVGVKVAV